jgi:hypothetical protein
VGGGNCTWLDAFPLTTGTTLARSATTTVTLGLAFTAATATDIALALAATAAAVTLGLAVVTAAILIVIVVVVEDDNVGHDWRENGNPGNFVGAGRDRGRDRGTFPS